MTTQTKELGIKQEGLLIFGSILLIGGLVAYFYYEKTGSYYSSWHYPHQFLGGILIIAGIIFIALGFLTIHNPAPTTMKSP